MTNLATYNTFKIMVFAFIVVITLSINNMNFTLAQQPKVTLNDDNIGHYSGWDPNGKPAFSGGAYIIGKDLFSIKDTNVGPESLISITISGSFVGTETHHVLVAPICEPVIRGSGAFLVNCVSGSGPLDGASLMYQITN